MLAPQGLPQIGQRVTAMADPHARPPSTVREPGRLLVERITWLETRSAGLAKAIRAAAPPGEEVARLMRLPGLGPSCAMAIRAFAPPMASFGSGRDGAACRERAAATSDGRQDPARQTIAAGSTRPPPALDHRGHDRRSLGREPGRRRGLVGSIEGGPHAAAARGHGARQQDARARSGRC